MIRVLYDSQAFDMQTHGGISRGAVEMSQRLPADVVPAFAVRETDNVHLAALGFPSGGTAFRRFLWTGNDKLKRVLFKLYHNVRLRRWRHLDYNPPLNRDASIAALRRSDYDVFHPTFFDTYFLRHLGQKPFVLTVHDLITELYPDLYRADDMQNIGKRALIPLASRIIVPSECTKRDLIRLYHVSDDKVTVVHWGADPLPYVPQPSTEQGRYLLFVGLRTGYKNFRYFVRYVTPVLRRHPELHVVCTSQAFSAADLALFDRYGVRDRFVHRFVRGTQELLDLYHGAVAFVFPSEYEGFGLPILEAYKAGCPLMLTRASCFPEIAGDAAVYFDMNDDGSDFAEQFEALYALNADGRQALLARQRERLTHYNWQRCAEQYAEVYRKVCKSD